ncbi:AraC family transcriptional regulator, L-rhamnose operon regulatory protein RhaS [Izhakiella capsodis]|uniref:Arabinose operon regulatory protein n=1 Tax=Izhakiella capsodis TaxID=1367852 RepID=A0A1I4WY92_9GAMM|nr:HTH-type transcriptional activator RhaS [Izhakiella capsodis]SFN18395.1 AraC family transcriptional regulator, L-rhamnose operon regulatory protein RhaS [Izhakiella capsodis]
MAILHSVDFFPDGAFPIAIEPRIPQEIFPEHHHDFHEIVLVEQGSGLHVLNGKPATLSTGCVCFIRDRDRHLYEQTNNLCLTNVLYRGPEAFHFINGLRNWLPHEQTHDHCLGWRISPPALRQARNLIDHMAALSKHYSLENQAWQETLFMQLLICLHKSAQELPGATSADTRLIRLLEWLNNHYSEEVEWHSLAQSFSLSLRTLHRQLKQHTGSTPQRYLTRLRLLQARHQLRHSDSRITDIAFRCGFADSNHFSTLFRREFGCTPRAERQQTL